MKMLRIISFVTFLSVFILQLHNVCVFPITRGPDAAEHIRYIDFLISNRALPLPHQGWEFFQPPLYYWVNSLFKGLVWIKAVNFIIWLALIFTVYRLFSQLFKKEHIAVIGTLVVCLLPVIFPLTITVNNELLTCLLISLSMSFYILNKKNKLKNNLLSVFFLSLAFLSKSTALLLFVTYIFDSLWRKQYKKAFMFFIIPLIISGWFYWRSFQFYHNPFIVNLDLPQFKLTHISPRNLVFFTDLSAFVKADMFMAHHYSLPAGTYFSWFYDGHNTIVPVQQFSKIGLALILFSLPLLALFLIGLFKSWHEKKTISVFRIYSILLFCSYIYLNIKYPIYSSVDARYLVSGILPYAYFVAQSIKRLGKKYRYIISLYLLIYSLIVIKTFWILPNWYNKF